ncbi:MAG: hypothetical protein NWF10_06510 [Candidatus Bathyarchaeota archaeon]|jgi:cation:H+ antiporter|nr:hypothetical protein [Candidatus Bathyarchaeota archaeon]
MLENTGVQVAILVASIAGLASSSHFAIKSVEDIIEITGLRDVSAGFILLSVLTSAPEIIVAIIAITQGNSAVSIGDILGSNIFNIGVVLGLLGILGYLKLCCTDLLLELANMLSVTTLIPLFLFVNLFTIYQVPSQIMGLILLIAFVVNTYLISKKKTPTSRLICESEDKCEIEETKSIPDEKISRLKKITGFTTLLVSFAVVALSAQLTVYSATNIAIAFGIPAILVGAKLVAIGTSLPELTLDIAAVRRGRVQLAIGGIIGSNLTNLTLVLGLVLLGSPFQAETSIFIEILPFLLITTIVFWRFITKGGISKIEGAFLLLTYIAFQILVI